MCLRPIPMLRGAANTVSIIDSPDLIEVVALTKPMPNPAPVPSIESLSSYVPIAFPATSKEKKLAGAKKAAKKAPAKKAAAKKAVYRKAAKKSAAKKTARKSFSRKAAKKTAKKASR